MHVVDLQHSNVKKRVLTHRIDVIMRMQSMGKHCVQSSEENEMSQLLPESIRCPECNARDGICPQYDNIDSMVYLSCDECGYYTVVTIDEFNQNHEEE